MRNYDRVRLTKTLSFNNVNGSAPVIINQCDRLSMQNNNISTYSSQGLIHIIHSENIEIMENIFQIDITGIPIENGEVLNMKTNPLWLFGNTDSRIIANNFTSETTIIAWLGYYYNYGICNLF